MMICMSEDEAWNRFSVTGKVLDYLRYSSLKNTRSDDLEGAKSYAGQFGRLDNNGKGDI